MWEGISKKLHYPKKYDIYQEKFIHLCPITTGIKYITFRLQYKEQGNINLKNSLFAEVPRVYSSIVLFRTMTPEIYIF